MLSKLIPFAPALLVFSGAILVAAGSLWQAYRQSNFNAEIRLKNEQIIQLQEDNAGAITGGDSFGEMALRLDKSNPRVAGLVFIHHGKYQLYEVVARIVELNAFEERMRQGLPITPEILMGVTLPVGSLITGHATTGVTALSLSGEGKDIAYNVFFTARNGSWTQQLRMHWNGTGWDKATKIDGLGKVGQILLQEVSPG